MGPLCSPNRARRAGHLPPLPLDKPPSRDHPCSFPIASLVYGTYQGFGQPAVARLSFGLGREGVAFTVPGVPETVRSIFQIWRHTQLVTGEPPPLPAGGGGERRRDSAWGRRQGGSCSAARGACACARLARRLPAQSALLRTRGSRAGGLRSRSSAPRPGLASPGRPAVPQARAHRPGPRSPPPPLAPSVAPPSPLSFPTRAPVNGPARGCTRSSRPEGGSSRRLQVRALQVRRRHPLSPPLEPRGALRSRPAMGLPLLA